MNQQDQQDGARLRELLDNDEGARKCFAFFTGEDYSLDALGACYGCDDGDAAKTYEGVLKSPQHVVDPTPEEVAAKFPELAVTSTTPKIEHQVDPATLDAMGADWVGRSAA
jgi:hypothetical protein